jgi:hypothetical protein
MNNHNFHIGTLKLHWIDNSDEEIDLCAHGQVRVTIGTEIVVDKNGQSEMHWTLSAMAMHLLRTLEQNHEPENVVGEHLIPCCGHHIDHLPNNSVVHIQGCMTGYNFWVKHNSNSVDLTTESGNSVTVDFEQYKNQVLRFVDGIEDFYRRSKKKVLPEDAYDRTGYLMFWEEWNSRKAKWK